MLEYRRRDPAEESVRVSPVAPWTLQRDPGREELVITDFERAMTTFELSPTRGWTVEKLNTGNSLVTKKGESPDPFELSLPLEGLVAVFAIPHAHGYYLQVGDDTLIRPLAGSLAGDEGNGARAVATPTEIFITIADLTDAAIRLLWPDRAKVVGGLASLRLTPVTAESVRTFRKATSAPPVPLYGVNDWGGFFQPGRPLPPRLERDEYDMIIAGQAEISLRTIDWDVGRSRTPDIAPSALGFSGLSRPGRLRKY